MHAPPEQCFGLEQVAHIWPLLPQAESELPSVHAIPSQQPVAHGLLQVPPHPLGAPPHFIAQSG